MTKQDWNLTGRAKPPRQRTCWPSEPQPVLQRQPNLPLEMKRPRDGEQGENVMTWQQAMTAPAPRDTQGRHAECLHMLFPNQSHPSTYTLA
ncbi:hypothetical protein BaRGS_00020252 [Batillaria attramentaria]|uniref:Uncharacterized protein n=1 Tax=Batillaria attramentaria TaxID=370345 RepID=A0ABD0KMY5_9CAEN